MTDYYASFDDRLDRIQRKHHRSRNFRNTATYDRDGYMVMRARRRRIGVPWSGLIMIVLTFFGIKGAVMAEMGPENYATKVAYLKEGSVLELMISRSMRPDPLSGLVAKAIQEMR